MSYEDCRVKFSISASDGSGYSAGCGSKSGAIDLAAEWMRRHKGKGDVTFELEIRDEGC